MGEIIEFVGGLLFLTILVGLTGIVVTGAIRIVRFIWESDLEP